MLEFTAYVEIDAESDGDARLLLDRILALERKGARVRWASLEGPSTTVEARQVSQDDSTTQEDGAASSNAKAGMHSAAPPSPDQTGDSI